jgi:hypothetical protein
MRFSSTFVLAAISTTALAVPTPSNDALESPASFPRSEISSSVKLVPRVKGFRGVRSGGRNRRDENDLSEIVARSRGFRNVAGRSPLEDIDGSEEDDVSEEDSALELIARALGIAGKPAPKFAPVRHS